MYEKLLNKHLAYGAPFDLELGYVVRYVGGRFWVERYAPESLCCWYFANQLTIWPDGRASPCPWLPVCVGNVKSESLKVVWERALPYKRLRVLEVKGCHGCPYLHICGAGCRARAMAFSGSLLDRDPLLCEVFRNPRFTKIYDHIFKGGYAVDLIRVPEYL